MDEKRCPACGQLLTGRFCGNCGLDSQAVEIPAPEPLTQSAPEPAAPAMQSAMPPVLTQEPPAPKKKSHLPQILIIAAALVALAGALALLLRPRTYDVHFDPAGGTVVSGETEQYVKKGEFAAAPVVSREGWYFDGWEDWDESQPVRAETSIRAKWTKAVQITFDPAGGEIVSGQAQQTLRPGSTVAEPGVTRRGYVFKGWDSAVTAARIDAVYTAQWERQEYTPSELYEYASPSVVEIHVYDAYGNYFAQGSGFFTDMWGTAATNYHVMEDAYSAEVITSDGTSYPVTKVVAWDEALDLAIIQCEASSQPLVLSERSVTTGEPVYTLGSSLGLTGTISDGIVSTASRTVDGVDCIQITAPISHGNSGGPLLDRYGEVVGINSMTMAEGQNLNFAIRIDLLDTLDKSSPVTMEEFYDLTYSGDDYMEDEGAWVFEDADFCEEEYNNDPECADLLFDGSWVGGYVDPDDWDFFTFTLDEATEVDLSVLPYYDEDADYLWCALTDENLDLLAELEVLQGDDGTVYLYQCCDLGPGTYYVYVEIDAALDYPYDMGAFYELYFGTGSGQDYPDDEGAAVFDDADQAEWEYNDDPEMADVLENGFWTAGYCGEGDEDWFSFTLEADAEAALVLIPYYQEDADYASVTLLDAQMEPLLALERAGDGESVWLETESALRAGTYYLVMTIDAQGEEYPYEIGIFYELSAQW